MFAVKRDALVAGLKKTQPNICCYHSTTYCDCKYGGLNKSVYEGTTVSEKTGCPEVRLAALLINAMTDEEYAVLVKKVGATLT